MMKIFLKSTGLKASALKASAYGSTLLLLTAFTLLSAYSVQKATGYSHGIVGQSRSGCANYGCHGGQSSSTVVKIWTNASQIVVGQTYTFHLSVANPSEAGAGCDVSVDNSAVLATPDPGLQVYYNEITHNSPQSFSGDSAVWTFDYTPKKTGTSHIYAAGNAVNLNARADAGDHYNLATYSMTVVSAAGPQAGFSVAGATVAGSTILRDTVGVGNTVTSTVWLHNKGTATLTIDHYGLKTGTVFLLLDTSAHSVASGDSVAIRIAFTPTNKGTFLDSLRVWSNDVSTNPARLALVGNALPGAAVSTSIAPPAIDLVIAPNPSNGRIVLRTTVDDRSSTADLGSAELEISDAAGRVVSRESVGLAGETPLDLSSEPNGSYFVLIQPKGGVAIVRRIVIAR